MPASKQTNFPYTKSFMGHHTRRLAVATNICAMSLEGLIDALERYNMGLQIVRRWQV
jgi:hypothetical protein